MVLSLFLTPCPLQLPAPICFHPSSVSPDLDHPDPALVISGGPRPLYPVVGREGSGSTAPRFPSALAGAGWPHSSEEASLCDNAPVRRDAPRTVRRPRPCSGQHVDGVAEHRRTQQTEQLGRMRFQARNVTQPPLRHHRPFCWHKMRHAIHLASIEQRSQVRGRRSNGPAEKRLTASCEVARVFMFFSAVPPRSAVHVAADRVARRTRARRREARPRAGGCACRSQPRPPRTRHRAP